MILDLLIVLTTSLVVTLALILINSYIRSRLAHRKFKNLIGDKIKILDDDWHWFGNHLKSFAGNKNVQKLHERHSKYGDYLAFLSVDLPTVSTTDLDLIKQVVIDKASVNINRVQLGIPMYEIEKDCIFTCADDQWRRIRRAFAPALKPARFKLPNVVAEIQLSIDKLTQAIDNKLEENHLANHQFDVEDLIRRYSLQLVLGCLYKQYNVINFNLNEKCRWVHLVDEGLMEMNSNPLFGWAMVVPELRRLIDWLSYHLHPIGEWRHAVLTFIKQQSLIGFEARKQLAEMRKQRRKSTDKRRLSIDENNFMLADGTKFSRNMVDFIVDQFHAGRLTKDEYFHSSFLLFGAADKTASDALVHTIYQLGVNQDIQEKLRKSLKEQGLDSEYLTWVTNESLRLNPPASIGCSRTLVEPVEIESRNVTLPAGTFLLTCVFTIHRLKKYWGEDAEEFKPERWAEANSFHPCQFIPFGAALRGCPGKEFAMFEMKMLVKSLVERYHFKCSVKEDILKFDSPLFIFNIQNSPLYMHFSRLPCDA